ncbi:hypothetical protein SARC_09251 [Sphaeroforma arctica JP610]|uniref:Uncharacterized protein n=1 Tax=Sphaeroforma arctica JP610 TaxID=667725 RepID=A0A0L0FND6_9EUKA|nr:hypothetical protein SARC_09251 [Sphaeroforma arctica JP610]KNC78315.1 hypothetical protein SARC_09251 [Sphaeroforma arctica JP610]|eukprot:XP_014152217.1 hypothetical protein SARC_09251 [Sphaeroforma arctica JP610]
MRTLCKAKITSTFKITKDALCHGPMCARRIGHVARKIVEGKTNVRACEHGQALEGTNELTIGTVEAGAVVSTDDVLSSRGRGDMGVEKGRSC